MSQRINKGSTFLILLAVALAITGVGVALDGSVIPHRSDTETIIEETAAQSALSRNAAAAAAPAEPSEVAQQLRRAVDAANRSEAQRAVTLEAEIAASKTKIEAINQLLKEKAEPNSTASSRERAQQFDRQLDELNARLSELEPSK